MFKWVNNTSIFLRLLLAFAWATILPAIVIVVLMNTYSQSLDTAGRAVQTSNQAITITTTELAHLQSMHTLLVALLPDIIANGDSNSANSPTGQNASFNLLSSEKSFAANIAQYQQQYQLATADSMADMRALLLSTGNSAIVVRQQQLLDTILKSQWPQYKAAQDDLMAGIYAHIPLDQATGLLQGTDSLYTPLLASWREVVTIAEQVNTEAVKVGPSQTNPILFATILAILGSMSIVFSIGLLLNQTITKPLRHLVRLAKRIMQGETAARANLTGRDEIAWVGNSMNRMLDTIVQLMEEKCSQRDELQFQVEKLISDVRGVAKGDLRLRADVGDNSLGVLASSSNSMIRELERLVMRIQRGACEVKMATMNVFEHMAQPIKIGNLQIQQVVEATTGIEKATSITYDAANHAQRLQIVADNAQHSVAEGRRAVQRTIDGINNIRDNVQVTARKVQALGEHSEEISRIAEVISAIAYQANRLALDSAIQAALVGENGEGFGPISVNIRKLAEQTKNHANLITHIARSMHEDIATVTVSIQNTEQETLQAVTFIKDVGVALNVIFTSVEHHAQEIATISEMTTQSWQSANRMVQIMPHISNTTQRNNGNIAVVSQHIQRLYQQVQFLHVSVKAFKVHTNQDRRTGHTTRPLYDKSHRTTGDLVPSRPNSAPLSGITPPPSIHPKRR